MSLARNTAYNLIGSAIPLAASIVTVPIYLRVIGLERYGLLAICWVLLGYMEALEFGLGTATAQRIALLKNGTSEMRSETVWAAFVLALIIGIAGALLLLVLAPAVLHAAMDQRSAFAQEVGHSILWLALLVPLTTCYSALSGALQGREDFFRLNLIKGTGSAALAVVPLLAALSFGPELRVLIVALLVIRVATVAVLFLACRNAVPLSRAKRPSRAILKSLVTFGGWVTGEGLLAPILLSAEKLAIGWLRTATTVSVYMIPFNILSRLLMLPQSLAVALIPRFAGMETRDADETTRQALRNLDRLATPLVLFTMLALKPFLFVWIGASLAAVCAPVGVILAAGFWFNSCTHVPYARLIGTGRPDLVVKLVIIQLPLYLALLYFWITSGGVIGGALAWSFRAFFELLLFLATAHQLRLSAGLAFPAILVIAAAGISFLTPVASVIGAAALVLLLAMSIIRSWTLLASVRSLGFGRLAEVQRISQSTGASPRQHQSIEE